ncbi:MAG: hypothetical protein AAF539_09770 [Planctomycetota bacterium]
MTIPVSHACARVAICIAAACLSATPIAAQLTDPPAIAPGSGATPSTPPQTTTPPLPAPDNLPAVDNLQGSPDLQTPGSLQPPGSVTPNAVADQNQPIDLVDPLADQPPAPLPNANFASSNLSGLGITQGSFSAAPTMIGDFFGGGFTQFSGSQTVVFDGYARGNNLGPGPDGSANTTIAYEFGTDIAFDDTFSTGIGLDAIGTDGADTFTILEPVPPTDAPTAPGPGFTFDGGTAVFTGNNTDTTAQPGVYTDGDLWYLQYSYTSTVGGTPTPGQAFIPIPAPGLAARRVKLSENFSPEVRDRFFFSYNFFNDVIGGLGDISRYILGVEKVVYEDMISLEARLPLAGTYASSQQITNATDRDFELGNGVLLGKFVLVRTDNCLWTGGVGIGLPMADDTRIQAGDEDLVRIENETVRTLPFTGLLIRPDPKSSLQLYTQLDIALNGDPVFADLTGGTLPLLGEFNDSTLMHVDISYARSLYRRRSVACDSRGCDCSLSQILGVAELHYTTTLQDADLVTSNGFTYTNLKNRFNVLNVTAGMHVALSNNIVISPAMSVPLRDDLDAQYDYEAIVQVNYLR